MERVRDGLSILWGALPLSPVLTFLILEAKAERDPRNVPRLSAITGWRPYVIGLEFLRTAAFLMVGNGPAEWMPLENRLGICATLAFLGIVTNIASVQRSMPTEG